MEHAATFAALYQFDRLTDPMREQVRLTVQAAKQLAAAGRALRRFADAEAGQAAGQAVHELESQADTVYAAVAACYRPPQPGRPRPTEATCCSPWGGDRPVRGRHGRDPLRGVKNGCALATVLWSGWPSCSIRERVPRHRQRGGHGRVHRRCRGEPPCSWQPCATSSGVRRSRYKTIARVADPVTVTQVVVVAPWSGPSPEPVHLVLRDPVQLVARPGRRSSGLPGATAHSGDPAGMPPREITSKGG